MEYPPEQIEAARADRSGFIEFLFKYLCDRYKDKYGVEPTEDEKTYFRVRLGLEEAPNRPLDLRTDDSREHEILYGAGRPKLEGLVPLPALAPGEAVDLTCKHSITKEEYEKIRKQIEAGVPGSGEIHIVKDPPWAPLGDECARPCFNPDCNRKSGRPCECSIARRDRGKPWP